MIGHVAKKIGEKQYFFVFLLFYLVFSMSRNALWITNCWILGDSKYHSVRHSALKYHEKPMW